MESQVSATKRACGAVIWRGEKTVGRDGVLHDGITAAEPRSGIASYECSNCRKREHATSAWTQSRKECPGPERACKWDFKCGNTGYDPTFDSHVDVLGSTSSTRDGGLIAPTSDGFSSVAHSYCLSGAAHVSFMGFKDSIGCTLTRTGRPIQPPQPQPGGEGAAKEV